MFLSSTLNLGISNFTVLNVHEDRKQANGFMNSRNLILKIHECRKLLECSEMIIGLVPVHFMTFLFFDRTSLVLTAS